MKIWALFLVLTSTTNGLAISCYDVGKNPLKIQASKKELAAQFRSQMFTLQSGTTSVMQINFPLVRENFAAIVYDQMLKDSHNNSTVASGFFSQFRVDKDGRLTPIVDSTIKKELGEDITKQWSESAVLRAGFKEVYKRMEELESAISKELAEAEVELAEVVFTYQVRKPSENWHLDWYDTEYIIGTQTFIAKKLDNDGRLVDEDVAGTEYLELERDLQSPDRISLNVNKETVVQVEIKGRSFTTPTWFLSLHSGTNRAKAVLGESEEYSGVSPAHRGSYKPLDLRGSIAVRFKRK